MAKPQVVADHITTNTLRTYYALDKAMMQAAFDDDNDRRQFAENTAHTLLENEDLPILIRARANMVLGCSDSPGFLDYAKEAVRIAKMGRDLQDEPSELANNLIEDCERVLKEAQEAFDEATGEEDDDDDAGEPVWQAGDEEHAGNTSAAETIGDAAVAGVPKKTKVGRLRTDPEKITAGGGPYPTPETLGGRTRFQQKMLEQRRRESESQGVQGSSKDGGDDEGGEGEGEGGEREGQDEAMEE